LIRVDHLSARKFLQLRALSLRALVVLILYNWLCARQISRARFNGLRPQEGKFKRISVVCSDQLRIRRAASESAQRLIPAQEFRLTAAAAPTEKNYTYPQHRDSRRSLAIPKLVLGLNARGRKIVASHR
jgi:hypothetical protein